jgi:sugar phosphate isomerase/epimerase
MKIEQVAAQLYTIRDHAKTPADIASAMRRIRAIGYGAVQVSGLGPIDDRELAGILKGEGLVCCATHEGNILEAPQAVAERLDRLDCKYTAYPYPKVRLDSLADVKALAAALNRSGSVLRKAGKVLAYHNHHVEFRRFEGHLMLEVLYAETDARNLQGEIDTYWVQYGGGDPAAWCARLRNRLPLLHMKDYSITLPREPMTTEVGLGNLDWKAIVAAAEASGCEWFIVEQDTCPGDPFESLKVSFEFIRDRLCA